MTTTAPARPWWREPTAALREEPFGALAYDFADRRLAFLRRPGSPPMLEQFEHGLDAPICLTWEWVGRVVLANGHGNVLARTRAVDQLRAEDHDVSWVACAADGDAHAGRTETSLLLHLAPHVVRAPQAAAGDTCPVRELLPVASGVRAVSHNGVLGDPHGATATEGAELFARMVDAAFREL